MSQILTDIPDIASVLLLDLDENVLLLATRHFFNGLLETETTPRHPASCAIGKLESRIDASWNPYGDPGYYWPGCPKSARLDAGPHK